MNQSKIYHGGGLNRGSGFSAAIPAVSTYLKKVEIGVLYTDFATAGLTKSNTLFSLPAGGIVVFIRLKPIAVFTGVGVTSFFLSVGIAGGIQDLMTEYSLLGLGVADDEYSESFSAQSFNYNNPVNILISARSVGANLDQMSQGNAIIELYYIAKVA